MVGVPVGSNPTSLTEIAEACHDYSKPNNLNSFRYVYTTDGGRGGSPPANGTGPLKYSQFTGKNVAYNVTGTGLLATGSQDQDFFQWSSFAASRGLEYFMLASPNNGHCEPRAFTTTGSTHATLTWTGGFSSQYRLEDHAITMAISRSGAMVIGSEEAGSTVSPSPRNAVFVYSDATNYSSGYWTSGYDDMTGFGTKMGHLVHTGNNLYIPTRGGLYGGYQIVTMLKIDISNSTNHSWDWYWGGFWHYGHSIQISENLDRVVIDNGPGASIEVYTTDGTNDTLEATPTSTGGTGHVYCNSDCSVIVSGSSIWHRSGTTWTAANTDEIVNRNIDAQTCDISDDGTIVVYKRESGSANTNDPNSGNQLNHFHYHKTNNKWYYTGNSNLGSTPALYRFLGGGFNSTNIGVRNDGLVIGKWDSDSGGKPKAYKGTIGVRK